LKKTIIFYAVNTISKIAARSVMKYRCAVIKKEIHAYGLPVYLEKMLSLAAAAHALVFIKADGCARQPAALLQLLDGHAATSFCLERKLSTWYTVKRKIQISKSFPHFGG